jgi:hypothetical protein
VLRKSATADVALVSVLRGVGLGGLAVVMLGLDVMAVREMGVVRRLLVVARGVVLVRLVVMLGGVLVVLGSVSVMIGDVVLAHGSLPGERHLFR